MSKLEKQSKANPEFPLTIEVTRSFPLRKIQAVRIKNPISNYNDSIIIDREQAVFLLGALSEIVNAKEEPEGTKGDKTDE